jgi:2-keto-4-pentenoate hydratase/2-oxohepta-3-ene-1,7-dioic acid hydratase in catechol pathway
MKLCRIGALGKEKPAIIDKDNNYKDLSSIIKDFNTKTLNFETLEIIKKTDITKLPNLKPTRFGACVSEPSKFIGIGLNFKDHAEEQNLPIPKEPIIFSKFTNCISGPDDDIIIPKNSNHTDWEVELGFVIGKKALYINEENALDYVLGFFLVNDVSERNFQKNKGLTWDKGKGFDSFGPIGPYIITKDELPDFQNLNMYLDVDGKRMQTGNTKEMIFDIKSLVSYMSHCMSLYPGDICCTGTPPGVGENMKPPIFLKGGEKIKLGIDKLGEQNHSVKTYKPNN